jgi:predicted alpha/beta hydrolase
MNPKALPRRRPLPFLTTLAFLTALSVTVAYFFGLVPGISKTLSLFSNLVIVTVFLLVVAMLTWLASLVRK